MIKKLLSIYQNSILFPSKPENPSERFLYFCSESEDEWIGIPKTELNERELNLLKVLYTLVEFPSSNLHPTVKAWHDFLFSNGPIPGHLAGNILRIIQFNINGSEASQPEIESALKGFFTEEVIIIWVGRSRGIVIEGKNTMSLSEEEILSMSETLESDFYVKVSFYIGKPRVFSKQLPEKFHQEKEYFTFALSQLELSSIFTFERVIPAYLSYYLSPELKVRVSQEIIELFNEDHEIFSTIKVFLENNLNASMTAKKLYIHRNTLQYRIDKFVEKTGISLKDFYGAFTVFLACLLFEQKK
ncbi:helix-turn-helix domain-containing protein [Neobacillus cucumis]|uniref:PucR family transcriptional regulator n=1 Tax=Neobacillus cucumis TaxID=1740721 RepID=UPI00204059E7|nr:helix-turn-helix domain-containing protein [Neobacillus cucumis]MCM3725572.1 helix-turn-helix domain-containing protein [Neobacillus cucumis]